VSGAHSKKKLTGYLTNTRLSKEDVLESYAELWRIEKIFRISKTDKTMPSFFHRHSIFFKIGKISIVPAIGYNYINYSVSYSSANKITPAFLHHRHSLFFKVGIEL
jgi:hypothetical protein